jgi:eukaryotic-like serine/threonine-protein kinase
MSCPGPDRVLDYLARRLDVGERAELEAHVDACPACRMLLGELARTDAGELAAIDRAHEPARVGRYRIEGRLGDGGMGTVYAAYDPQLERRVAVKLVHPELAVRGGVERLLREGRALARLSHPNVVRVHDASTDGDRVYVAMELVEGETLAAWLRGARRGWREIVDKFVAAGHGLAAAHRAGIVHRDVKPENVLLDRDGIPKVADFGLAGHAGHAEPRPITATEPDPASRLTHPGAIMGTPAFMSPEQRRGDEVGPATDQYSLCAALDSALFDEAPQRRIPRWLRRALERGLARDAAARFRSIDALVAALDPRARARRRRGWLGGAGAAAAAAGVVALVLAARTTDATGAACALAAGDRARLWTAADRTAISAALGATGVPYARESWNRVDAAAAGYVHAIAAAEATLCDQRPQRDDARALQALGVACLAERRGQLARLTERLRHASAADVRLAVALVHDLEPVPECANPRSLATERAARATPVLAAARGEVTAAIHRAYAARTDGKYPEASEQARRAVEQARLIGGAVLARALVVRGDIAGLVEGPTVAEAALREAATVADTAQADELRASAMANLMGRLAREAGREREALTMRALVEAAVARSDQRVALMPVVQQAVGIAQLRLGQVQDAVDSFQAALAAARAVLPRDDPRMPEYLYPLGVALDYQENDREALRYHDEAYRVALEVWGDGHPNTARYAINRAFKEAALGDCPKAMAEVLRARSILAGVLPADATEHLMITELIGTCHYFQREYDAALREHTARQHVLVAAGREHSAEMAASWVDIGDVQLDREDYPAAIETYRRAVTAWEEIVGKIDARVGLPLARLGDAELRAGHRERAVEPLERALALFTTAKISGARAADARFPLARALWVRPGDRPRALSLAESARAGYAASPFYARRLAEVEDWLRAHPR